MQIPWRLLAVGSVLLLWAAAVWFVLTARSVTITAVPANASIEVRGWLAPRIGNHWLLREGPRAVRVSAPGHITFAGEIPIGAAQIQSHEVILERLPGHLDVSLTPPVAATILVDGSRHGEAPGMVRDIPAGTHEIEIRAPRYRPYVTAVDIEGKGIEQSLAVVLEPAWAEFAIDSEPSGAAVTIDDAPGGTTPLASELLEGRRVVRLTRDGYKPWQQTLDVVAGREVKLGTIVMSKADGRVRIASVPAGASITLDGEFIGRTPFEAAVAPDKDHSVRLIQEGFVPAERTVKVASGGRAALDVELEPELATIQLTTTPADAELLIDGEPRGSATQTLSLPTHPHEIIIRRAGHATYKTTITPRKGVEKRFRIRLKTLAEMAASKSPTASSPVVGAAGAAADAASAADAMSAPVRTFAGQEMKLFKGGDIVLGAPARDPARRANEVERAVRLVRPFYLSVKEVTNGEFRLFLANHHAAPFEGKGLDADDQPAASLSWTLAALYCNWLSRRDGLPSFYQISYGEVLGVHPDATGYRLPTEAEWEWAARTAPGSAPTIYAWGDRFPPRGRSGNYADAASAGLVKGALREYDDGFAVAAPVGSFHANLHGLYDMGGNVAEWVHDYYAVTPGDLPVLDPLGPPAGEQHVIKGASWAHASAAQLRLAVRDAGSEGRPDVGFRLARYAQ